MGEAKVLTKKTEKLIETLSLLFPSEEREKYELTQYITEDELNSYEKKNFVIKNEAGKYSLGANGFTWIAKDMKRYWRIIPQYMRLNFVNNRKRHTIYNNLIGKDKKLTLYCKTFNYIWEKKHDGFKWKRVKKYIPYEVPRMISSDDLSSDLIYGKKDKIDEGYIIEDGDLYVFIYKSTISVRYIDIITNEKHCYTLTNTSGQSHIHLQKAKLTEIIITSDESERKTRNRDCKIKIVETKSRCPLFLDVDTCKQKTKLTHKLFNPTAHFDYKVSDGQYVRLHITGRGISFKKEKVLSDNIEIPLTNLYDVIDIIKNPLCAKMTKRQWHNCQKVSLDIIDDKIRFNIKGVKTNDDITVSWKKIIKILDKHIGKPLSYKCPHCGEEYDSAHKCIPMPKEEKEEKEKQEKFMEKWKEHTDFKLPSELDDEKKKDKERDPYEDYYGVS